MQNELWLKFWCLPLHLENALHYNTIFLFYVF